MIHQYRPFCPGGYVLRISSDRDDRRFLGGLKNGKYFVWYLDLSREFFGYSKQSEDSR